MTKILIYIITSVVNVIITYLIVNVFVSRKDVYNNRLEIICYFVYGVLTSLMPFMLQETIPVFVFSTFAFLILLCNYYISIKKMIFILSLVTLILLTSEFFSLYLAKGNGISLDIISPDIYLAHIYKEVLLFIFYMFIKSMMNIKNEAELMLKDFIPFLGMPIFSVILIVVCSSIEGEASTSLFVIIFILFLLNINIFYLYRVMLCSVQDKVENVVFKEKQRLYLEQIGVMDDYIESAKGFRHDLKNHLLCIKSFIEKEDKEQAIKYIEDIFNIQTSMENTVSVNNPLINSILNIKLKDMEKYNINFTSKILIPKEFDINTYDLVVILGNILDNAIEANIKDFPGKRFIKLYMKLDKGRLIIKVSNSFNGIVKYGENKKILTQKKDGIGGLGIKNINKIVRKYNGQINIDVEKQVFSVNMVLYKQ